RATAPKVTLSFVRLEDTAPAFTWPEPRAGAPWTWQPEAVLTELIRGGHAAAIGTALFTGRVLASAGVNTRKVFAAPPKDPGRPAPTQK
ncbi:MAG: hypothetical protein LBE08_08595, partial [Bifidobacteriaceae bacterium]|nr:hypothetical protein [Bifidobacteriaceae bacterium]